MVLVEETAQSYVAGDTYDEDNRIYWCQASYGDCGSGDCSTLVIFRSNDANTIDEEEVTNNKFVLYPNPTRDFIRLEANQLFPNESYTLRIYNALGQQVQFLDVQTNGDQLNTLIDMSREAGGVYYMALMRKSKLVKLQSFVVQP